MTNRLLLDVSFFLICVAIASNVAAAFDGEHYLEANLTSLLPTNSCTTSNETGEDSMKLSPRYGPCSPLSTGSRDPDVRELLRLDRIRVAAIQTSLNSSSPDEGHGLSLHGSLPARSGTPLNTANYVITISLGTPRVAQTVMFETGTTLTLVQCSPCVNSCYPQSDDIFDTSQSYTNTPIYCNGSPCNQLSSTRCGNFGRCIYGVGYGDGSSSNGYLVRDTLALSNADIFPGFVFGCAQDTRGFIGRAAGIAGLSRGPLSLVSQTSAKFGKVFSYCLPAANSDKTGDLTLGPVPGGNRIYYTPIITDYRDPSLYFLELTGISVAGNKLSIPQEIFSRAGTMIDSGTVITRLPRTAYSALRAAFRKSMASYYQRTGSVGILDTCYDFTGQPGVYVPRVVLYFGGGTLVELAFGNIMLLVERSQVCLAFAGNADDAQVGIIGNVQQAGMRVVYDLASSTIGFGAGSCI